MDRATIEQDDTVIGTIERETTGYRIWWRERSASGTGNTHRAEDTVYAHADDARQAVWRQVPDAMIQGMGK